MWKKQQICSSILWYCGDLDLSIRRQCLRTAEVSKHLLAQRAKHSNMLFVFMSRGKNSVFQKIAKARHFPKKQETSWPQGWAHTQILCFNLTGFPGKPLCPCRERKCVWKKETYNNIMWAMKTMTMLIRNSAGYTHLHSFLSRSTLERQKVFKSYFNTPNFQDVSQSLIDTRALL